MSGPAAVKMEALLAGGDAFSRKDENDDRTFYALDRFVSHLDAQALSTVAELVGTLVVEPEPAILDLMASWDSHLPPDLRPREVVGLGLNERELVGNPRLTQTVIHDLNLEAALPFEDGRFDVVLNTVSVDYLTRPFSLFREAGRVLKPGGLFLVVFSNRMFPEKAVKIWRQSNEIERLMLVEDFFKESEIFEKPRTFVSKGRPRPKDDKYAGQGLASDPVYAVYADRTGGSGKPRPEPLFLSAGREPNDEEKYELRKARVNSTLECPHCGERMKKWLVPDSPYSTWDVEHMYICFNDDCPYLVRGWDFMGRQGNLGLSYRQMYNPVNGCLMPVPVPSLGALRESIVEEEATQG